MSEDDNDSGSTPADCYWYQQGKCFLYEVPEQWVFQFLARSPKAREDLLKCAGSGICPYVDDDFVEFAESGITLVDAIEASDEWQSWANTFVDNHRNIRNVYRTPPKDDE